MDKSGPAQRIDKWLWHARFARTRTLAARLAVSGQLRLDRARVTRASAMVRPGNVLTLALGGHIHILRITALAERRGSAADAQLLYDRIDAPAQRLGTAGQRPPARPAAGEAGAPARRPQGAGRQTKKDRRALKAFINRNFSEM